MDTLWRIVPLILFSYSNSLASLTLEEKIGQLLMVHIHDQTATVAAQKLINELHIGGIIYYNWANGLTCPQQVKALSSGLQRLALESSVHLPLMIAIDHEGGPIHRFESGFTHFPPAFAYALCNDLELTEQCAYAMGSELRTAGISMNLAPVADVMSNPLNPIIGTRAYGTTPDMVIAHARAMLAGFHHADIATSLKHFPGHGDTDLDSHVALPIVSKNIIQLAKCEFVPFYALAHETDSIMTAHIMVPELDPLHCATLSPTILDMLRSQADFDGIIISDSLVMESITHNHETLGAAAIKAFNAGCDLLLLGGRQLTGTTTTELSYAAIAEIHQILVDAVLAGKIRKERLDEAVTKILTLKKRYPFSTTALPDYHAHQKLAYIVAQKALAALTKSTHNLSETVFENLKNQLLRIVEVYHENLQ